MRTIRLVVVGDAGIGKIALLVTYITNKPPSEYVPTVFENYVSLVMIGGEPYALELCDTSGQEEYDGLRPSRYPGTDVFVVLFSVVNPSSFENAVEKWIPEIKHHCPKTPFILVGNDTRLRNDAETLEQLNKRRENPISTEQGNKVARKMGAVKYVETDPVIEYHVKEVFDEAIFAALGVGNEESATSRFQSILSNITSRFRGRKKSTNEGNSKNVNTNVSVPEEIKEMDEVSIEMYMNALKEGKEKVYDIRIMIVGPFDVGKTTLTNRLLMNKVNISKRRSTNGIDVHVHSCGVRVPSGEWIFHKDTIDAKNHIMRIAKLIALKPEDDSMKEKVDLLGEETGVKSVSTSPVTHGDSEPVKDTIPLPKESDKNDTAAGGIAVDESDMGKRELLCQDYCMEDLQMQISSLNIDEERKNEILYELNAAFEDMRSSDTHQKEDIGKVSVWDFGGQFIFYSTHQVFLSARAIYILVIDISKSLGDEVKDECLQDATGSRCRSLQDRLLFWMNSIHTYSSGESDEVPPILLVATHLDKLKGKKVEKAKQFFDGIRRVLADRPVRFHLANEDFAIDNTKLDPRLDDLRKKIYEISSTQKHWGEEIPARWISLENALKMRRTDGQKIISFDDVANLNRKSEVSISDEKELLLFLRFEHEIGNLIFFNDESLMQFVVLEPQWLIDAFKCFITAKEFCTKSAKVASRWHEFFEKAILRDELIIFVWKNEKGTTFYENKDHLLKLMERMDILARPSLYPSVNSSHPLTADYYLAPCMLSKNITNTELNQTTAGSKATPYLCYVFSEMFVPPAVFHRLLAACMGKWPVVQRKEKLMMFCGCGLFHITDDKCNRLLLSSIHHVIQIRIFHYGLTSDLDTELVISVREFITRKINSIIRLYHRVMPYTMYMKCKNSDHSSLDGMLDLNDLLKFPCMTCDSHDCQDSHPVESKAMLSIMFADLVTVGRLDTLKSSSMAAPANNYQMTVTSSYPVQLMMHNMSTILKHQQIYGYKEETENQDPSSSGERFLDGAHLGVPTPVILQYIAEDYAGQAIFKGDLDNPADLLQWNVQRYGMVFRQETPSDGNSFFHAIKDQLMRLNLPAKDHVTLRHDLVGYVKNLQKEQLDRITKYINSNLKSYLSAMLQNGTAVDSVVVECMAKLLNRKMIIVSSSYDGDRTDLREQIVNSECGDFGLPLLLGHIHGAVYQSLGFQENFNASDYVKKTLKKQIRRNYKCLVKETDLSSVATALYTEDIFSLNEKELVGNAQPNTTEKKNRITLDLVLNKNERCLSIFLDELKGIGHEDMADRIQNTNVTEKYQLVNTNVGNQLKERIRRNMEMLVMDTILENQVDEFYSKGIFSVSEKEIVENAQPNTVENKNRLFLDILLTKRSDSLFVLMDAFIDDGRDDIVQTLQKDL